MNTVTFPDEEPLVREASVFPIVATPDPDPDDEPSLLELAQIAIDALKMRPRYIKSIFGSPLSWLPPHNPYSEYQILNPWHFRRMVNYLANASIPAIPLSPPHFGPPLLENFFWKPSEVFSRPDHYGSSTSFPHEAWYFINGILTDKAVAQINAAYLAHLFHRPIGVIQNATDSFPVDLLECILGKELERTMEPTIKAVPVIYEALKRREIERVVVIAHSQGTIIMANVLCWLYALVDKGVKMPVMPSLMASVDPYTYCPPEHKDLHIKDFDVLTYKELAKLEVYNFATCANWLCYYDIKNRVPWLEHFGNEYDYVARLGMLAPYAMKRKIKIHGPRYLRRRQWGHLLNIHYLFPLADAQKQGFKQKTTQNRDPFVLLNEADGFQHEFPRLFNYINGGPPA